MRKLIGLALVLGTLAAPALSFAQSNAAPITRAQVRAQLVELEQAGYNPSNDHATYPANLQAAQARVNEQHLASGDTSGYGAPAAGTAQAGGAVQPPHVAPRQSVYFGN